MAIASSLFLLLCAALTTVHGFMELECSRPDPSPLNFDLFLELLSNHTDIARTLRRAPVFSDMDHDIPAYEIRGRGFHLTNDSISTDIRRALCSNNEVTFYASMYITRFHSHGTLLEISAGEGPGMTVFGVYFNAAANEIFFTYRHQGVPHTVAIDQRLHTGRWRKYAFVLSGHLLQFYYDCELVFSDIVSLPDFCINDTRYVVSFAEDAEETDVAHGNWIHGYFQKVGFYFGRGGLGQQCPGMGRECPTCGQYLQLVQKAYALHEENKRLKTEVERLSSFGNTLSINPGGPSLPDCRLDDVMVPNGEFMVMEGAVCFCQNRKLVCNNDLQCKDNSTNVPPIAPNLDRACDPLCGANELCRNGTCECVDGYSRRDGECTEDPKCRITDSGVNVEIHVGERYYSFVDGDEGSEDDQCRVYSCELRPGITDPLALFDNEGCHGFNTRNCSTELNLHDRNISVCCQQCRPCNFISCGDNEECTMVGSVATCTCLKYYEKNKNGNCVDIDECVRGTHTCEENSMCVNLEPQYTCPCAEGYAKNDLRKCEDVNECDSNPCPSNSVCNNTHGSFDCICDEGYENTADKQCSPICANPCQNGGTCVDPDTCKCHPGYTGLECAEDINECDTPNHMCTHEFSKCVNTIGGHFCRCKTGFMGNGTFCEDIDECASNIDKCIRKGPKDCINTQGSYICSCDMTDCTGYCRRRGKDYPDGKSFIDEKDSCMNCTCLNGMIFCHRRNCDGDCSDPDIKKCCFKCNYKNCVLERDNADPILIRRNAVWVDPKNPCIQWNCDTDLNLTRQDKTSQCPPLDCDDDYVVDHPGRCCPTCLLPPCTGERDGLTVLLSNGCKECTCKSSSWMCSQVVTCPGAQSNCEAEEILFYNDRCCPVCESDIRGSTCQTFARN